MKDDFYGEVAQRVSQRGEGATIDVKRGQEVSSGWAAAREGYEHVEPRQTFSENSLRRYAGEHREPLEQAGYMGLWHPSRVYGGRPKGIYHDVVDVKPNTYQGGLESIVQGYGNQQDAIFNMDRFDEAHMHPKTRSAVRSTRTAMRNLAAQRPGGVEPALADMPSSEVGRRMVERRPVQAPDISMADELHEHAKALGVKMRKRGTP